jgi:hypothetical protein
VRPLAAILTAITLLSACKGRQDPLPEPRRSPPLERVGVEAGTERDIQPLTHARYARSLEAQLDLVPPDADAYLVVRDLRPLIAEARRVEQVMAGPLARAIPALAKIGDGSPDARLAQLASLRELLALGLAGLESAGIDLDRGVVVVQGQGAPLVLFSATAGLGRLGVLAGLAGVEFDVARSCGALEEQPGWFACSFGGAEQLAGYRPAMQGAALAQRLEQRFGAIELERVNLAVSAADTAMSLDALLRTDPGLWELSMPVPMPEGSSLLAVGPAPALRALVPGTSFSWARVDPRGLAGAEPLPGSLDPAMLTGELWFGVVDQPHGFAAQAGITNASEVAKGIQALSALLPPRPIAPEQLGGLEVKLDRASIDVDGKLVPSLGLTLAGEGAKPWAETLGVEPRARVWAYGEYLSLAIGEVQAIPAAIGRLEGSGPSPAAIAGLPPTLARSLIAGEVALVMHLVLDHWQAPASEAELDSLLAGVPPERRPEPAQIGAAFQALAPWSTCAVWLRQHQQGWIANFSLVPFAGASEGVSPAEREAAGAVLDEVLLGGDGQAGYRQLLARFPASPRAYAYRARIGEAPTHHAAAGMLEVALVLALAATIWGDSEAP